MSRTRTCRRTAALVVVLSLTAAACSSSTGSDAGEATTTTERTTGGPTTTTEPTDPDAPSPVPDGIRVEVLSSQPDRASGPDARVRITPAVDMTLDSLVVTLGDRDVTDQFTSADGALEGVVTGLVEGNNSLDVTSGSASVTQRIRSWPLTGPMISGPQTPLLACSTEAYGLGPATDSSCNAPTRVIWKYVTTGGETKDLVDPTTIPPDVARVTVDGTDQPMVIRVETGVVDRSVYEIASLDPSPGGSDASQADAAWNGRLVYRYGAGCGTTYGQGTTPTTAVDPTMLARGYAVATATFNTGAVQCNDVVSAETTMMVKERFIEEFGRPEATIAEGREFGTAQIHLIAQNYPGLLDAAVAVDPLPDAVTLLSTASDCGLLNAYYRTPAGKALTPQQRTAVNGSATTRTCDQWEIAYLGLLDPSVGCDPAIPADARYAAGSNPGGIRCTFQDGSINQYGRDEATSFALRPLDNVGIQYGLNALDDGAITFDQFVALNEDIGGYDIDGTRVDEREQADLSAVQAAYETGRVSTGVGDLPKIPIIELSLYDDATGSVADHLRPFSLRDRLTLGGPAESAPGFRIWTRDPTVTPADTASASALAAVDDWLSALEADPGGADRLEVLRRTRPEAALDSCLPAGAGAPISATELYEDKGPCRDDYPVAGDPRIAAGAPRSDDILKCQLKPVDPSDYARGLSEAQFGELNRIFPAGVCDWDQGGFGQTTPSMSDRNFGDVETPGQQA